MIYTSYIEIKRKIDSESMGWYGASLSLVMGLIGPLLIALLQRCLPDEIVLQFGYLSSIVCFAICGIASHTWMLYTGDVFFSFVLERMQ
jgi:hypothetical protein